MPRLGSPTTATMSDLPPRRAHEFRSIGFFRTLGHFDTGLETLGAVASRRDQRPRRDKRRSRRSCAVHAFSFDGGFRGT